MAYHISTETSDIILVRSSQTSSWDSCVSITNNLETAYRNAFGPRIRIFEFDEDLYETSLTAQIQKLYEAKVKDIVFIDHHPSITAFVKAVDKVWKDYYPRITIHTFGGFTYRSSEYVTIEEILKRIPLKLVAPSTRSKCFLENHFDFKLSPVSKVPFPVSTEIFKFDEKIIKEARSRFNVKESDHVFTYAGRIAAGKNIDILFKVAQEVLLNDPHAHFYIAGEFDDSVTPGFEAFKTRAEEEFHHLLSSVEAEIRDRVHYVNKLSKNDLKKLFHVSDVFVSLSTYPLEDFGMGPLEALASGCPAILSNWGGYSDFASSDCSLVDVSISDIGITVDAGKVSALILKRLKTTESTVERRTRSQKYQELFSPERVAEQIKLLHLQPGITGIQLSPFARAYIWIINGEKLTQVKDTFYHSLYRSYFE